MEPGGSSWSATHPGTEGKLRHWQQVSEVSSRSTDLRPQLRPRATLNSWASLSKKCTSLSPNVLLGEAQMRVDGDPPAQGWTAARMVGAGGRIVPLNPRGALTLALE